MSEIRTVNITRYVTPLREGGSLPAIVEADDGFLYVIKFRGAGQGLKALIAEFIGYHFAELLGLKIPEMVLAQLDDSFSKTEPDEEIQDLLQASVGLNLGFHYLSGAITFDPLISNIDASLATKIVALDALLTNVDRTAKNTNMLIWHKELWLIDHGASLYFHHTWDDWQNHSEKPFLAIKNHVLLSQAQNLMLIKDEIKEIFTDERITEIVNAIPEEWLMAGTWDETVQERQSVYIHYLKNRIINAELILNEAENARKTFI